MAKQAACPGIDSDATCHTDLHVLGLPVSPGSLVFYVVTLSTIFSALFLPVVGALADRIYHRKALMCGLAWVGSVSAAAMYLITGSDWQLGVVLTIIGNICLGSALVVYYSFLVQISDAGRAGPGLQHRLGLRLPGRLHPARAQPGASSKATPPSA